MSESIKSARGYDATVARVAGNILSGILSGMAFTSADEAIQVRRRAIVIAVDMARDVVKEVKRTEPREEAPK